MQATRTPRSRRARRVALGVAAGALALTGTAAVAGAAGDYEVIAVSRSTTASVDALWQLWADPANSPRWDRAVESSTHDGPFATGQTGTVTVAGQPTRRFVVLDCRPKTAYTDRFFLPAGGRMDWHHTIDDQGAQRTVTFRVTVTGPSSLVLRPILASVLQAELPATVDTFVRVAEADTLSADSN